MSDQPSYDALEPDLRQAECFLTLLGEDSDDWTFQTFDDNAERHDRSLARILHKHNGQRVGRQLIDLNRLGAGVFVMVNRGDGNGRRKENVVEVRSVFLDLDGTRLAVLDSAALDPHIVVESSPGRFHAYWRIEGLPLDSFEAVQVALAARFGGDSSVRDLPRVMRLPGFCHLKGSPFRTRILQADPLQPYLAKAFLEAFAFKPEFVRKSARAAGNGKNVQQGGRNNYLASLAGSMRRRGMNEAAIEAGLQEQNRRDCEPPLGAEEVKRIALSIGKYPSADPAPSVDAPTWPDPIAPEAYYGLAGNIVSTFDPHTEADPVAILGQLLVAFGSIIGRGPHYVVEADIHRGNLYTLLVGDTSKARKGTALRRVLSLFQLIHDPWAGGNVTTGLYTGGGLISNVRDPITQLVDGEEEIIDVGVTDKRLLAVEEEFASTLRRMAHQGNTLSAALRQAWDTGDLRTLTKNNPVVGTDAHISIIGHITRDELCRDLDRIETGNGFANRFLFQCVRRSKRLPFGGSLPGERLKALAQQLTQAIDFARTVQRVEMDDAARAFWEQIYGELSEGQPGLTGAVTSRAEAQVLRLALLYALLDQAVQISVEHLRAALAVWNYAEASAQCIFGSALGDPIADEILRRLRAAGKGMARTEISTLFGRHKKSAEIGRALELLKGRGLAGDERRDSGGRQVEVWRAT